MNEKMINAIVARGKDVERASERFQDLRPSSDENLFFADTLSPRDASSVHANGLLPEADRIPEAQLDHTIKMTISDCIFRIRGFR